MKPCETMYFQGVSEDFIKILANSHFCAFILFILIVLIVVVVIVFAEIFQTLYVFGRKFPNPIAKRKHDDVEDPTDAGSDKNPNYA